ncbi:protein CutA homolog isoform X2 [Brachyhypopomus gauderio]|uniref:protein CutA homolog isoform X2 n=1 Tax=Brachyhypopomus gauderio TaxID=698409 RepID=UPI0040415ED4
MRTLSVFDVWLLQLFAGPPEPYRGGHIMEKRMAACVNILPRTSTMYYWKGEIQDTSEILLLVRTRTSVIQKLTDYVKTIHPYDIPEILSFPVEGGSLSYLKWMDEAVPEV